MELLFLCFYKTGSISTDFGFFFLFIRVENTETAIEIQQNWLESSIYTIWLENYNGEHMMIMEWIYDLIKEWPKML